jgi:hypothetical protein
MLKMEWCLGTTLHTYVEEYLDQPSALLWLSERWRRMINELQEQGIGHGDLQHDNVLVSNGRIKLVDYDAMFVPSLKGEESLEPGHDNFQHPKRAGNLHFYNERIDDFAALVVYTSLRALAVAPSLWKKYHNGDNLIFTSKDYLDISNPIWKDLQSTKNNTVNELAEQLRYFSCVNINQVGAFEKVVNHTISKSSSPSKSFSLGSSSNTIILEYSESLEADTPSDIWAKRITLFSNGEIQGMYVQGQLPPIFKEVKSAAEVHEGTLLKKERLCLRTGRELHNTWTHKDGTNGRLKMFRAETAKADIVSVLRRVYKDRIDLLPDEIGVIGTNGRKGSLIYDCFIDRIPVHKEITFFSHDASQVLIERYDECASSIKKVLLGLVGELGREDFRDVPMVTEKSITPIETTPVTETNIGSPPAIPYPSGSPVITIPIILLLFGSISFLVASLLINSSVLFFGGGGLLIVVCIIVLLRGWLALWNKV